MENDLYGGQEIIWNMLRNRKKPVNESVQTTNGQNTLQDYTTHKKT